MTIGIVGLGRFGAFWGSLFASSHRVIGWNRSDRPTPGGMSRVDLPGLASADAVFICSAISSMPQICEQLAGSLKPGTLVMDTCSVKVYPAKVMNEVLPASFPVIPLHPMFGPDSASAPGRRLPIVICPSPEGREPAPGVCDFWKKTFEELGMTVVEMTADEHDRTAARTQGVTHFVGRLLEGLDLPDSAMGTLGYQKIREVVQQTCNDPWQLFLDLQRYNPYSQDVRDAIEKRYRYILDSLVPLTGERPEL